MSESVRVLIVDDAAFMRRTLVRLMRQAPDVQVVGEARNGREAVELFTAHRPDVICLDIDMPEMDGMTALKHFMATRPTPVVVVSSMTDRDNVPFELFRLGVIDFFPKPSSLVGAVEDQTRLLLYLVRNAKRIHVENLARVPVPTHCHLQSSDGPLRHVLVVAGAMGSVGSLIRLLALLPPSREGGLGMICMVPLHEAIASSFQSSIAKLYGWEAEWFEARTRLSPGHALLVRSGAVIDFADEWTCTVAVEKGPPLDTLFATAGRALRGNGTMVLLGGDDPAGVDGLAAAQLAGAQCYLQDPKTALFCSWPPLLPAGIPQLDLEAVAAGVRVAMADAGSSGA